MEKGEDQGYAAWMRERRLELRLTQKALADLMGVTNKSLSRWETGGGHMPFRHFVKSCDILGVTDDELLPLIGLWIEEQFPYWKLDENEKNRLRTLVAKCQESLPRVRGGPRSLAGFPAQFLPLTVVTGDRRETPAKTKGDLFVAGASPADLAFLGRLKVPVGQEGPPIVSDKVVAMLEEPALRRNLGQSNLLVLGSASVNLVARLLNWRAVFRVDLERRWHDWATTFQDTTELNRPSVLRAFTPFLEQARKRGRRLDPEKVITDLATTTNREEVEQCVATAHRAAVRLLADGMLDADADKVDKRMAAREDVDFNDKDVVSAFRRSGILDPSDGRKHGISTGWDNDFGVISVAENPWADPASGFVAILVCGIHGPATAVGLRALVQSPEVFENHPFGGTIEVEINDQSYDWASRFENARFRWQTDPYDATTLVAKFEAAVASVDSGSPGLVFGHYTEDELRRCIDVMRRLLAA